MFSFARLWHSIYAYWLSWFVPDADNVYEDKEPPQDDES